MIENFCYAAANNVVTHGQSVIIFSGLIVGLALAARYRYKSRDRRYLNDK